MAEPQGNYAGVMDTTESAVAAVYAKGLLDCIPSDAEAEEIARELAELVKLLGGIAGARELLTTGLLSSGERQEMVSRVMSGRVSQPIEALLDVMARRGRLGLLAGVAGEFRGLLDSRLGKIEATVHTAFELDDSLQQSLTEELSQALGGQVVLKTVVDGELLGGAVVQVGDRVYDCSVATKLKGLSRAMTKRLNG